MCYSRKQKINKRAQKIISKNQNFLQRRVCCLSIVINKNRKKENIVL